ncbi:lanthionine synthetase LanC family protein [Roseivirga sp.]|uniref:lanthionine synthetase LanC family protein n=1 Tax=Roseivirga sp. TaxID=1964215 RepID=UPI003B8C1D7E
MKSRYSLIFLLALLLGCQLEQEDTTSELMSTVLKAEKYLQNGIVEETSSKISWKVMPDSTSNYPDHSLYSGNPGVILFYLELYNTTNNTEYLRTAQKGADAILTHLNSTTPNDGTVGLYTGVAGIGYTLAEVYSVTKEEKYKNAVIKSIDLLAESATKTPRGIQWGMTTDIVYGAAGIGLYLNEMSDQFKLPKADSLSILIANQLLAQTTVSDDGMRWKMSPEDDYHMDNFSHGTAGVAYYLAKMYQRTQSEDYYKAAIAAGNWLAKATNEEGLVAHHYPGGEDLYYLSWCHGPSGTSRLYYTLYEITGENRWIALMDSGAEGIMALNIDKQQTPGFWNNVGKCCGNSGVAEHFLWLYEITGNDDYLFFAKKMTKDILWRANENEGVLKWIHAENRRSPDEIAAQTGLMQGTAGIGLWLLQLNAFEEGKPALIQLPDKPEAKRINSNTN